MNQQWFEDIINQSFNEDILFNPTKLIIVYGLVNMGTPCENNRISTIAEYVYQTYIDNLEVSRIHSNYVIRNIQRYGVVDLRELIRDALISWSKDAINDILQYNDHFIWLNLEQNEINLRKSTSKLCEMLYKKNYNGQIPVPRNIEKEVITQDDHDLNTFGKGVFRNRVLQDMQYCPLCESVDLEDLYCVHIVEKSMGATINDACNKNNGLLLCKKHAEDFIARKFYFDELGFAHEKEKCGVEKGMHLSFEIRNSERKEYLKKRLIAILV